MFRTTKENSVKSKRSESARLSHEGYYAMTYAEIGAVIGVSPQAVYQIEARARAKIEADPGLLKEFL